MRFLVIFLVLCLLLATGQTRGSPVSYTLYGSDDSAAGGRGWGFTSSSISSPGPELRALPGETVELTLYGVDSFAHNFWIDYDDDSVADPGEYSKLFAGGPFTYSFTAGDPGVYTYYCEPHFSTMFGTFIITGLTVHDVAVSDVAAFPATIVQGGTVTIEVVVKNEGDFSEDFAVTAYYNESVIRSQSAILASKASRTVPFLWDTVGAAPGGYRIKAVAETVAGETNTDNNMLVDGIVDVTSPSDAAPPSWPASKSLTASTIGLKSLTLEWSDANDNVGVVSYRVFQDGSLLTSAAGDVRSYPVTGLSASTSYTFKVEAGDAANNWSTDGPSVSVTTSPESEPPSRVARPFWEVYWLSIVVGSAAMVAVVVLASVFRRGRTENPPGS